MIAKRFACAVLAALTNSAAVAQYAGEGGTDIAGYYSARVAHIQMLGELFDGTVEPVVQGSGFLLDDRYVLTANHIAPETGTKYKKVSLVVRLGSRQESGIAATMVARDASNDLALIELAKPKAPSPYCPVSALMPPALLKMGSLLYVIGYPLSRDITLTPGLVGSNYDSSGMLQTDAVINPGNSGGPVFSSKGYLVAIAESSTTSAELPNGETFDVHGLTDLTPVGRLTISPVGEWLKAHSTSGCWRQSTSLPTPSQFAWTPDPPPTLAGGQAIFQALGEHASPNFAFDHAAIGLPNLIHAAPAPLPPQPERLSVDLSITELKDDHTLTESRRDYQKIIPAASGYLIDECAIEIASAAHERNVRCTIADDRRSATISFELASGPAISRWRGWLRATVSLGQLRIVDPTAALPEVRTTRRVDISKYQTTHGFAVTSQNYSRYHPASPGKRIVECAIEQTSANHADAIACRIDANGAGATVTFRLRSGPWFDQWRGWLNGRVVLSETDA